MWENSVVKNKPHRFQCFSANVVLPCPPNKQPLNNGSTLATSPILPSAPKSALQPFHRKPRIWLSDICNPFPSRPSIVLSPHKPFYSPPNYSSWWLGILVVLISNNLFNRLPSCKQKQASGWDRKYILTVASLFSNNILSCDAHINSEIKIEITTQSENYSMDPFNNEVR